MGVSLIALGVVMGPVDQAHAQVQDEASQLGTLRVQGQQDRAAGGRSTSAKDEAVYREPSSKVQINHDQIERYPAISSADVLRGQPGVQLGDGRNGGALDVNIRGVQGQSRVAVTVDGSQQALDVYRGYAGTQQRSYIDPALISSITVAKGAQSGAATGSAIGGTVAMQTLTADDILRDGQNFGIRFTGDLWNNGLKPAHRTHDPKADLIVMPRNQRENLLNSEAEAASLGLALRRDKFDLIAAFANRNQGNYISGTKGHDRYRAVDEWGDETNSTAKSFLAGDEVLNTSAYSRSALLKSVIRPTDEQALELAYRYYDAEIAEIMPSDIYRYDTAGIQQYPSGEVRMNSATARYTYNPLSNPYVNLGANLWWTDTASSQLTAVSAPRSEHYKADRHWTRLDNERVGADITNTSSFYTGYGAFDLTLGAAYQHEDIAPQSRVVIDEEAINRNRLPRNGTREEMGLSARVDYRPTEALHLWVGGRYSRFESEDRNRWASPRQEVQYGRFINVTGAGGRGSMFWLPDAEGNFTDATDPRLNNGIVFSDSNNPLDGIRFNDFGATNVQVYDPQTVRMVVGFDLAEPMKMEADGFAPTIGANYEFAPDSFIYASYTEALRMPSVFESSQGTQQVTPNASIKPERARTLELGVSTIRENLFKQGDHAAIKLVYFNNNIKDYITRYYDPTSPWGQMTFSNADSYKTSGLELQTSYDVGRYYANLSATHYFETETCDADFAKVLRDSANQWMPTENTPDCTPGSYRGSYANTQNPPEYAVNLDAGVRLYDERLTLGGRMVYTSGPTETMDQPWQIGATTPQIYYPEVTLFDAYANLKVNERIDLKASVQNIGDRYYLDPLAQSFMPSPGRTVRVGLVARF